MGIFRRLFSSDHRAAVEAEATGDLELAAERYALAGDREAAVRVHLSRAERADSRQAEIAALRDALHWAPEDGDWRRRAARGLGLALVARARAEGVSTDRDRERLREAAVHLAQAGEHRAAGEAFELCGETEQAAAAYRAGGLVDRLEATLGKDEAESDRARTERQAFADYDLALRGGDRDGALAALRRSLAAARDKAEHRRLCDELEARLITGGRVVLAIRRGERITVFGGDRLVIGRDPLADLTLRSAGVSRHHAEIRISPTPPHFQIADGGSRNGTRLGGVAIAAPLPLAGAGELGLGDDCAIGFSAEGPLLHLAIERGLDRGTRVVAAPEQQAIGLDRLGLAAEIVIRRGRPFLRATGELRLGDDRLAVGEIQLIHGDLLGLGEREIEVA